MIFVFIALMMTHKVMWLTLLMTKSLLMLLYMYFKYISHRIKLKCKFQI